jgi:hypothetical protein
VVGWHEVHVQGSHVTRTPGGTVDLAGYVRFATDGVHAPGKLSDIESPIREGSTDALDRMDLLWRLFVSGHDRVSHMGARALRRRAHRNHGAVARVPFV